MELTEGPRRKVREDTGSLEALRAQLSQQVHETTKAKGEVAALTACMTDHMAPMMDKMAKQAKHITHQLQLKDDTIKQLTLQCQQKEAALQSSVEAGAQKDATIASQHSKIEHWRSVATKQEQACKEAQGVCSEKDAIIDTLRKEAQKSSEVAANGRHRLHELVRTLEHKLRYMQKALLTTQRQRDAVVEGEAQAVERTRQAEASAGEARPAKRPGLLASLQGLGRRSRTASAQAQEAQQHGQGGAAGRADAGEAQDDAAQVQASMAAAAVKEDASTATHTATCASAGDGLADSSTPVSQDKHAGHSGSLPQTGGPVASRTCGAKRRAEAEASVPAVQLAQTQQAASEEHHGPCIRAHIPEADSEADDAVALRPTKRCRSSLDSHEGSLPTHQQQGPPAAGGAGMTTGRRADEGATPAGAARPRRSQQVNNCHASGGRRKRPDRGGKEEPDRSTPCIELQSKDYCKTLPASLSAGLKEQIIAMNGGRPPSVGQPHYELFCEFSQNSEGTADAAAVKQDAGTATDAATCAPAGDGQADSSTPVSQDKHAGHPGSPPQTGGPVVSRTCGAKCRAEAEASAPVHHSEADGAADGAMVSRPAKRCRFSLDGQEGDKRESNDVFRAQRELATRAIKECPSGKVKRNKPSMRGSKKYRRSPLFMESRPGDPCTPLLARLAAKLMDKIVRENDGKAPNAGHPKYERFKELCQLSQET